MSCGALLLQVMLQAASPDGKVATLRARVSAELLTAFVAPSPPRAYSLHCVGWSETMKATSILVATALASASAADSPTFMLISGISGSAEMCASLRLGVRGCCAGLASFLLVAMQKVLLR